MSDPIKGGDAAPVSQPMEGEGNSGESSQDGLIAEVEATPDTVAYQSYNKVVSKNRKVLSQNRSLIDENAELRAQLEQHAAANKAQQEQELVEQNRWEEIAKQRAEKLQQVESENIQMKTEQLKAKKVRHVIEKLPVKQKFWHLIEDQNVKLMPDTGEVDEESLLGEVERIKNAYPEVLDKGPTARLYNGAPIPNGSGKITTEQLMQMPLKERKENYKNLQGVEDWMLTGKMNG